MKRYAAEEHVRHCNSVIEITGGKEMPFDSVQELQRYLSETGRHVSYPTLHGWIGDGKEHGGSKYEYEREQVKDEQENT